MSKPALGRMMAGGTASTREADDFYPTPVEATIAFMRAEDRAIPFKVWEPACGDGAMARVLTRYDRRVVGTDLVHRGYGTGGKDFLLQRRALASAIITNPPWGRPLSQKFITHALSLNVDYVAMLLKSTYFHAEERGALWHRFEPSREYKLTWRLDFMGRNHPAVECSWYVWDRRSRDQARMFLLPHPNAAGAARRRA